MGNSFIPYQGSRRGIGSPYDIPNPMDKVMPGMSQAASTASNMQQKTETPGRSIGGALTGALGGAGVAGALGGAGMLPLAAMGPVGLGVGAGLGALAYLLS